MTAAASTLDGDGWPDVYVACDSTAAIALPEQPRRYLHRRRRGERSRVQRVRQRAGGDGPRRRRLRRRRPARRAEDPLRRRHPRALPQPRARARSRTWRRPPASASQNRYVEWGAGMADLDNDGRPDILYVTGNVYPEIERAAAAVPAPRAPHRVPEPRRAPLRGRDRPVSGPGATTPHSSRGVAFGDFDNDGDLDVLVMNMNEPPSLLRNDYAGGQRAGSRCGSRDALEPGRPRRDRGRHRGRRRQARAVLSQSSYYSHDDLRLHFGLGDAPRSRARRGPLAERDGGRRSRGAPG